MGEPRTASVLSVRLVIEGARKAGLDVAGILSAIGLTEEELRDVDRRVPAMVLLEAWDAATQRSQDPFFGLHVGENAPPGIFDVVDYAVGASATLGEALEK